MQSTWFDSAFERFVVSILNLNWRFSVLQSFQSVTVSNWFEFEKKMRICKWKKSANLQMKGKETEFTNNSRGKKKRKNCIQSLRNDLKMKTRGIFTACLSREQNNRGTWKFCVINDHEYVHLIADMQCGRNI